VLPGVADAANARVAEEIRQTGNGGECRCNQSDAEQPNRRRRKACVGSCPVEEIADQRPREQTDREGDEQRVQRVPHEVRRAHWITSSHGSPPNNWLSPHETNPKLRKTFLQPPTWFPRRSAAEVRRSTGNLSPSACRRRCVRHCRTRCASP